jgi:HNH endonuclease
MESNTHDLSKEELGQETQIYRFLHQVKIVKDTARRLEKKGAHLGLTMQAEKGGPLEMQIQAPHLQTITELAVTLEPLIRDSSDISYTAMLDFCAKTNSSIELDKFVTNAKATAQKIKTGPMTLQVGKEIRPADWIYERFMDRLINASDVAASEYQNNLDRNSVVRDLLMFQFYNYCLEMGGFVLWLENAIKRGKFLPKGALRDFVCVLCKRTAATQKFSKVEHTLPESLGNTHSVLPLGYCCDECQGVMAPVEAKVVKSVPFAMTRLWFTKYTKSGKFPSAKLGAVHYAKTKPNLLRVDSYSRRTGLVKTMSEADGTVAGTLTGSSKFDPIALGRVLMKGALGAMALEMDRDYVLDPRFDPARFFVLTGQGLHTRLLMRRTTKPNPQLEIRWWDLSKRGAEVVILIHGIEFAFVTAPVQDSSVLSPEVLDEFLVFELESRHT